MTLREFKSFVERLDISDISFDLMNSCIDDNEHALEATIPFDAISVRLEEDEIIQMYELRLGYKAGTKNSITLTGAKDSYLSINSVHKVDVEALDNYHYSVDVFCFDYMGTENIRIERKYQLTLKGVLRE